MRKVNELALKPLRPERIIQFGVSDFLRGYIDWMIQKLNLNTDFNGSVVVVKTARDDVCSQLEKQNCLYTHVLLNREEEKVKPEKQIIDVISRAVKPGDDFQAYLSLADNPALRFIFSHTSDQSFSYTSEKNQTDKPTKAFPAMLTQLLHARFVKGLPGFWVLPCEPTEKNGDRLKDIILQYAKEWNLPEDFVAWLHRENHFINTNTRHLMSGASQTETVPCSYQDDLLCVVEPPREWMIKENPLLQQELPLHQIGLCAAASETPPGPISARKK